MVAVGDRVLFIPQVPSWSKWLKFTVNSKYYSIGTVVKQQGEFATVVDITGQEFVIFSHQMVLLDSSNSGVMQQRDS